MHFLHEKINRKIFDAVIFDFDGVIFHSEPIHLEACNNVLQSYGISIEEKLYYEKYVGLSDHEMFPLIFNGIKRVFNSEEVTQVVKEKIAEYKKLINSLPLLSVDPNLINLLDLLKINDKKIAICSGVTREEIDIILAKLANGKLQSYFDTIISIDNVSQGKPSPDGYLLTAKSLNVQPQQCLVIEDTPHGIQAAKSAGMYTFGLAGTLPEFKLQSADKVIFSLADLV